MSATDIDWLAMAFGNDARTMTVDSGECLFCLGDLTVYLFLVLDGEALATRFGPDGVEIPVQRSRGGELFAETGMLEATYSFEGYCLKPSRILGIPLVEVRARILADGKFALRFLQFQFAVTQRQSARIECLRIKRARNRVLSSLNNDGPITSASVRLKDWARDLRLEPATLSRTLAQLESEHLIHRHDREISLSGVR